MAYVTPIYKSGKKSDPQNYRPVSLTSVICKVMKHILTSHIMQHLEEHDILVPSQFGFSTKHSCESQLLIVTDDFAKVLNNKLYSICNHFLDHLVHFILITSIMRSANSFI